ncbi:hypothetical protein Daura_23410 [Dactylosporangium aurantiacum]|uniref:Polyketide antibiotic transporter n=1 Tax=Dactylosporangium aurantiacum TaxID=35754 RepID=A0A9Q9ITU2_9ACTN|nr:hypothetical protein [Dactylosporangium aurantiacum]MDG6103964.1 hypothetical protein [Dactylosporangium aurantiacum]UWZ58858.1 hypothetical protein Daura_23410 [Dactylosporangium aurantiacum]
MNAPSAAPPPPRHPSPQPGRGPAAAVTRLAASQVWRGATVVTVLSAGMTAVVAGTYRGTVGDALDRRALLALAGNPAVRTMFGEPVALDTAGGFTAWRTGTFLAVLLGVWGILATTRITRGEEDTGRWALLLAGRVSLRASVVRHVAVVAAAPLVAGAAVSAALLVSGTPAAGAALYGAGLALIGLFAVAVAALCAQLLPSRGTAAGTAVVVFAAGLLMRMLGDGTHALAWLRWLSPFGLAALTRPFDADRPAPLAVLATATALVLAAAVTAAARRDLDAGLVRVSDSRPARLALLGSVTAFAMRRAWPSTAAWAAVIGGFVGLLGCVAASMTAFLRGNPRFAELAAQAGFAGLDSVTGYAATMFALLAVPAGVFAAVRVGAIAEDERARRLTLLYAGPLPRARLLAAETAAAVAGVLALAVVAATAIWAGAAASATRLRLLDALAGTVNTLPIALLCLGAGVAALGWRPRVTVGVGTVPAVGGFVLKVVADSVDAPGWVAAGSPFQHLALVPQVPVDWTSTSVMLTVAAVLWLLGAAGYQRRDLGG